MNQTAFAPASVDTQAPQSAAAIALPDQAESLRLAQAELKRFLALLDTLSPADWQRPTECALWSVKDIVAHQASHVLALTRLREFVDQFNPLKVRDYMRRGMNSLDAANQRQVDKRSTWTPEQIVGEIREHAEASMQGRQAFPALLRRVTFGTPGYEQRMSIGELIDVIFTRDMWMHRLDICVATGQAMAQTAAHDGRITALVVRDLGRHLATKLPGRTLRYRLTGVSGGEWMLGDGEEAEAVIRMDALEFHRLASGRMGGQAALEAGLVMIEGDRALGEQALKHTVVLY